MSRKLRGPLCVLVALGVVGLLRWELSVSRRAAADEPAPAAAAPVPADAERDALDAKVRAALRKRVHVDFVETPLSDVLNFVQTLSDIDFYVDWRRLNDVGIDRTVPLNLNLRSVPVEMLLDLALDQAGDDAAYSIREGIVIVSSREHFEQNQEVRVYNVRDAKGERLVELLTAIVAPDSWVDVGGTGTIVQVEGLLVVRNTPRVHEELATTLDKLRTAAREPDPAKDGR